MKESMQKIHDISSQFQKATGELDATISALEDQLRQSCVQLPVWQGFLLNETILGSPLEESPAETAEGYQLGYAEIDGVWSIGVRRARVRRTPEDRGAVEEAYGELAPPIPLSLAPRHVLLEAAGCLGGLMEEIADTARRRIDDIARAKRLVQS